VCTRRLLCGLSQANLCASSPVLLCSKAGPSSNCHEAAATCSSHLTGAASNPPSTSSHCDERTATRAHTIGGRICSMAQRDNQRTTEDEKKNAEQQQQHDPQSTPTPTKAAAVFSLSSDVVSQPIRTLAVVELQHVLTYLKSLELLCVSRVSRVWYSAVDSPLVWQHLDPREDDPDLAQLTSKDFARQDFLTSAQCSAYGYEDTLVSSPWYVHATDRAAHRLAVVF
jgi:hypothetical protein